MQQKVKEKQSWFFEMNVIDKNLASQGEKKKMQIINDRKVKGP